MGATTTGSESGNDTMLWLPEELLEFLDLFLRDGEELPGLGMLLLRTAPRIERVTAIEPSGDAAELLLDGGDLAQRNRQEPFVAQRHTVFELQLLFEPLLAQPERGLGARREVGFEVVDVGLDRTGRLGRRVGEVAEDVEIVERREGRAGDRTR